MIENVFHVSENGFYAEYSDLEANLTGRIRLQSGQTFDSLYAFMDILTPHFNNENELTHWTYITEKGKTVTVYND